MNTHLVRLSITPLLLDAASWATRQNLILRVPIFLILACLCVLLWFFIASNLARLIQVDAKTSKAPQVRAALANIEFASFIGCSMFFLTLLTACLNSAFSFPIPWELAATGYGICGFVTLFLFYFLREEDPEGS